MLSYVLPHPPPKTLKQWAKEKEQKEEADACARHGMGHNTHTVNTPFLFGWTYNGQDLDDIPAKLDRLELFCKQHPVGHYLFVVEQGDKEKHLHIQGALTVKTGTTHWHKLQLQKSIADYVAEQNTEAGKIYIGLVDSKSTHQTFEGVVGYCMKGEFQFQLSCTNSTFAPQNVFTNLL